jgi:glycerol-3-phosphate dehydrogenase (NAD(P)+)
LNDLTKKIGLIGNGSWGTALAKLLTENKHEVHWWIRNQSTVQYIKDHHQNPNYLQSVKFNSDLIKPTTDLNSIFEECEIIIFCVPAAYAEDILAQFSTLLLKDKIIVSAIKGILPFCNQLLNDYLNTQFQFPHENYVAISGPCHAEEVAQDRLSYLTFSSIKLEIASKIALLFEGEKLRTICNHDLWGTQLAAVLKNVYALGAGIANALDYGDNFMSVYITNCFKEMHHFLEYHFDLVHPSNIKPDYSTSAYLGDLLVTGYSLHSRNRRFGMMIGKGYTVEATILEMNMVAEGYYASKCMKQLSKDFNYSMPIAEAIFSILWENKKSLSVFENLENSFS